MGDRHLIDPRHGRLVSSHTPAHLWAPNGLSCRRKRPIGFRITRGQHKAGREATHARGLTTPLSHFPATLLHQHISALKRSSPLVTFADVKPSTLLGKILGGGPPSSAASRCSAAETSLSACLRRLEQASQFLLPTLPEHNSVFDGVIHTISVRSLMTDRERIDSRGHFTCGETAAVSLPARPSRDRDAPV
jgi:hypothetical protein